MKERIKILSKSILRIKLGILLIALVATTTPIVHKKYIRDKLQNNLVYITDGELTVPGANVPTYAGSGFYLKAKSGKLVIITNKHVCGNEKVKNVALNINVPNPIYVQAKVLKTQRFLDLCALESVHPEKKGLVLAKEVLRDEASYNLGYPLRERIYTQGEVQEYTESYEVEFNTSEEQCPGKFEDLSKIKPKNMMEAFQIMATMLAGIQTICEVRRDLLTTTNIVTHGSSGSPIVDKFGGVLGVVARLKEGLGFAEAVPLIDLRDFVSDL